MVTLASLMTLAQRPISVLRNSENCSGVLEIGSTPAFCIFSMVSGIAAILIHPAFNRLTMSRGVPAGARIPYQPVTSQLSIPASFAVGTLARDGARLLLSTASGLTLSA